MHQKLAPDSFLILLNNPKQPVHGRNYFKSKILKEDYQKALKILTLVFLSNPVSLNGQNCQKQKGSETSDQSLFRSRNRKIQKNSFIRFISSDQIWWCNVKQFLSYSKNYICKFMQVNSWHYKLFHFHLSFWIWKVLKGKEKITKIWKSRERE